MDLETHKDFFEFIEFVLFVWKTVNICSSRLNKRRFCVREMFLERDCKGFFATTFQKLKSDPQQFFIATRMQPAVFEDLYSALAENMEKNSTRAIPPDCRLFLTLV